MTAGRVPADTRRRVAEAAGERCGYCRNSQRVVGPLLEIDHIVPESRGGTSTDSQFGVEEVRDLIERFDTGPDLAAPRPHLRIIPGKPSGEPHVEETRIPSVSICVLHRSGYTTRDLVRFYPVLRSVAVAEAIELEASLAVRAA